jgi:DNA invertase Pin-like site-specific DNA recombinase
LDDSAAGSIAKDLKSSNERACRDVGELLFLRGDLPQIEGATGRFLLQQMVAVAELEAGMISARTKAALAAAKKRGKKLGGNRGVKPTAKMRARSTAVLQQRADARAADIAPTIRKLQAAGATSLRAIAAKLNEAGIPTARGQGEWSAVQVQRVLERIA